MNQVIYDTEFFVLGITSKDPENGGHSWLDFIIVEKSDNRDAVCEGFLKRDGCMEYETNLHICSPRQLLQIPQLLELVYVSGVEDFGFDSYAEEIEKEPIENGFIGRFEKITPSSNCSQPSDP